MTERTKIIVVAVVVLVLGLAGMNVYRSVHRLASAGQPATSGPQQPVTVPQTPQPTSAFVWDRHGSSAPTALDVVTGWLTGTPDDAAMEPAAYEDAVLHPAPANVQILGTARVTDGGPTEQDVTVPTNRGTLLLTMHVQDGSWVCTSLGWAD